MSQSNIHSCTLDAVWSVLHFSVFNISCLAASHNNMFHFREKRRKRSRDRENKKDRSRDVRNANFCSPHKAMKLVVCELMHIWHVQKYPLYALCAVFKYLSFRYAPHLISTICIMFMII